MAEFHHGARELADGNIFHAVRRGTVLHHLHFGQSRRFLRGFQRAHFLRGRGRVLFAAARQWLDIMLDAGHNDELLVQVRQRFIVSARTGQQFFKFALDIGQFNPVLRALRPGDARLDRRQIQFQ